MNSPRLLSNRYELGDVLGYGGMSEVHKGRDVRLGRDVAVKVLRADLARDPQFQERFRREAQNAAALNHPAIVAVYDTGETRTEHGPLPYIVMEYVDGRTLRDIVKTEGPLPGQRAMEVMADVCAALDFSHRHGIVHRDVKPANVMITKTGAVKVMDFGIARAVADGQAAVTQTAAVIGTAQYLSPEQARGEAVDARSDVYAAGCVLFELLTGDPPFTGDSPVAVAYQHVREDPKPPSSLNSRVSPALDAIVLKAMSKGAPNRYQSSAEMRTDLVRVLSGQRPLAPMVMTDEDRTAVMSQGRAPMDQTRGRHRPQTLAKEYDDYDPYEDEEEERRRRRKKGWLIALVAVLGIALIGVIVWLVSSAFNTEEAPPEQVTVPDVIGQDAEQARSTLTEDGFTVRTEQVPCQPTPDGQPGPCGPNSIGQVIATDPAVGTTMDKADRLTLKVGAPAEQVDVPDLTGMTPEEAKKALTDVGLTIDPNQPTQETEDENLVGKVVDQSPEAGQPMDKGGQVSITIGEELETVGVPDLTGQDVETARANLENFGFQVQTEEVDSEEPAGTVVGQDPSSGQHPPGTTVTLQVSNGELAEEKIVMPNLTGLFPQEAEAQLRQLGWEGDMNVQQGGETDDPTQFGRIVEQEIAEGQEIDVDQEVGVRVASELNGGGGR
ncbi:Stk1 family PASTA domain-containing Ser/Thr kinase [Actinophytocola gossypii]|uniref:non-specific serine/threonine protein kinase n=1 Tax=Actinophytocola gossypii TaxID=2812003 RepID=A0ABT2JFM3_9PSEU|nr:Stk1 family PASTA domain-containing Ser/Thr kinase [Actinophytocola gossypii]MCT2586548.1 Stk1 family PASTA domain-containing Ser/Thr kinase [Actinophytocola gossypii]